jgi:hypothetical protein
MSNVTPLSSVTPAEPQTEPEVRPGSINNASLDAHIERGLQSYEDPEQAPEQPKKSGKDLDTLISEGLDKFEKVQRDEKAWDASLESRDSLRAQYSDLGPLDGTLRQFLNLYSQIKNSPIEGSDAAIRAFSEAAFRLDIAKSRKIDRKVPEDQLTDPHGRRYSGLALDRAIELAMEKHGVEDQVGLNKQDQVSKPVRDALNQLFGDIGINEQLRIVDQFSKEALRDPYAAVAKVFKAVGGPPTPAALEEFKVKEQIAGKVDALARSGHVPAADHEAIAQILNMPGFQRTNDPMHDLVRAQAVVTRLRQQEAQLNQHIEQQFARMDPAVAAETHRVIMSDPSFRRMMSANRGQFGDPSQAYTNFSMAIGYAQRSIAEKRRQQKALSRAMGARPTKNSSGAKVQGSSSGGDTLDAAINAALSRHFD